MSIVIKAIEYATEHHKTMVRKGTKIPYLTHLFNVCKILAERNCDDHVLAAALLHDIVEDTEVTIEQVNQRFGPRVAQMVEGATEPFKLQKEKFNELSTWKERKEHTIHFIEADASLDQCLVMIADKIDNIRSIAYDLEIIGETVWDRFNASKKEQQWYYVSLYNAFDKRKDFNDDVYDSLVKELGGQVVRVFALSSAAAN
jgi:(p)ppGpp synthase/HD superfamily hydrolase